jgi:hypothetical protein
MSIVTAFVKRHPLVVFFILVYALTWPLIPLVSLSPLWGFPALVGPALAAVIVATVADGRPGLKDLLGRGWSGGASGRAGTRSHWAYPWVLALTTAGLHLLLGAHDHDFLDEGDHLLGLMPGGLNYQLVLY